MLKLMNGMRRLENPLLVSAMRQQWKFSRICLAVVVQTGLLLVICQLLFRAKLGSFLDLIFLSEGLLTLIVAPYLVCSRLNSFPPIPDLLQLSPMSRYWRWGSLLLGSQIYPLCFFGFAAIVLTIFVPQISNISYLQVALLHVVFGIYIFVGAAVGGFWWHVFRNELFAIEMTYCGWALFISGVFLLSPLDRYLDNLQPVIPPFLHLNPLIAVCQLLQIDVFRTPYLYELTPITSYLFVYPSWFVICGWQALIGICGFVLAARYV